jgi:hypothetical protein
VIGGKCLIGETQLRDGLDEAISYFLKSSGISPGQGPGPVDLISRFKSFNILAIVSAGLVDGINPCAFTVIVFFITFLTLQQYRKKEIIITGLCFILAVFLTYLLLGVGLFRALYSLRLFYLLTRMLYVIIAAISFILGFTTLYDIIKFKRTGKPQDMVLVLPERVKYYIHRIIGTQYRQKDKEGQAKSSVFKLITAALFTGFLVSLLEAVCTGQLYLPTIAFVLKVSSMKVQALFYLIVYNLMFVIPLCGVFLLALLGVTSGEFAKFMQKRIMIIKMLLAIFFLGLGLILVWRI